MCDISSKYNIKDDIEAIITAEKINNIELADKTKVSRTTLDMIMKTGICRDDVLEKIYAYDNKYRINSVKEELAKEKYHNVLFHGSKYGLTNVTVDGSRDTCDFGNGFYLGETYQQALAFVSETNKSSVYSFKYALDGLNIKRFECDLEWMLAICYYRNTIKAYSPNEMVQKVVKEVEKADVIIAPIADNKMFYIMSQFTEGEINADVALHSLSASKLGLQYIFKTDRAINNLVPIERYYLSKSERDDCRKYLNERSYEIDTKLRLAKREFKDGLYIEEILK